jgi:phosphatidate phosphatase APP1
MAAQNDLTRHLRRPVHALEKRLGNLSRAVRRRIGYVRPPILLPYRTYGTDAELRVRGRVIEDPGLAGAPNPKSLLDDLRISLKRYSTFEVPGAEVEWRLDGAGGTMRADEEGFFETTIRADLPPAPADNPWRDVRLTLKGPLAPGQTPVTAQAHVLTPPPSAEFGIISDIDDTIVVTGATNFLKNWRTVVASSAQARVAFPGLAPFYRALARGTPEAPRNPVFYVSSSPWNLYDLLERFLALHAIPLGPLLLKDFGLNNAKWLTGGHDEHKTEHIETIFTTYPHLSFLLIGDSGQRDTEIYTEIVRRHGSRVRAVYIRDVTHDQRDTQAKRLLDAVRSETTRVAYGPDLVEAAEDAAMAGWIAAEALDEVKRAVAERQREGAV